VALSGNQASIAVTSVNAGTRSITATYNGDANFNTVTSNAFTQTVNQATTTATLTLSPFSRQYSDLETYDVTLSPGLVATDMPATGVTFQIGAQVIGTTSMAYDPASGNLRGTLSNVPVTSAPGTRIITAAFSGVSNNFVVTNPGKAMNVMQEDARTTYTGPTAVQTACHTCSTATINLKALVQDITAVDPVSDPNGGDIRNATVVFVNRGTGATIGTVNVTLTGTDVKVGQGTFNWTVDIGKNSSQSFAIGMVIGNYYARNSTTDNVVVTVSKP